MTPIQARRQLIVILLLCTAAVAAVVRHFAEPGSTTRDVSTVMMLLWLPVIGSIVGWCYGKLRRRTAPAPDTPPGFRPGQVFAPHALVDLALRPAPVPAEDVPAPPGEHTCVLVVGHQGFMVRWQVAAGESLRRGETRTLPMQFLSPDKALPLLPAGTPFRMMVGEAFIGDGRMLRVLADQAPSTA